MDKQEILKLIDRNIEAGLAEASRLDSSGEASRVPLQDCPPIPRISHGLMTGFTPEEEEWAIRSDDFQNAVRIFWRVRPVSLWLLARYVAEGDRFPFAPAIRRHLAESEAWSDQLALRSSVIEKLARVIGRGRKWSENWKKLQNTMLEWESKIRRTVIDFPLDIPACADTQPEPFAEAQQMENGLIVELEEIRSSRLLLTASRPAKESGPSSICVTLTGESGEERRVELTMKESGEYVVGRSDLGDFRVLRERLGERCLMVVSPGLPPEPEE